MNKFYVGQLSRAYVNFNHTDKPATVELKFKNGDFSSDMPFKLDHEYYVVEKSELDTYIARKEHLEQMNCTPVYGENQQLKAKIRELEAENETLKKENGQLKDEVKQLTDEWDDDCKEWDDECKAWKARYAKVTSALFQKDRAYENEKTVEKMLIKDRDALKEQVEKLEAELTEIKTARNLREAYITGVEKACEDLREERDRWKRRFNSVVTDISKHLEQNGIEFVLKEINGDGNWDVVIDIPKLTEAKKKITDLEEKLAASKSNEAYWRDRKKEEEDHYHYWLHVFDRVVEQAAKVGVNIGVTGTDECNAGIVVVENKKASELLQDKFGLEDDLKKAKNQIDDLQKEHSRVLGEFALCRKQPEYDHKKLEELKKRTVAKAEITFGSGVCPLSYTYVDGHNEAADINSLDKNYIDAESISCGTIPKCSSCAHYMSNPSRFAHRWCYKQIPKERIGTIRKLTREEAEGPACAEFEAKE